MTEVIGNIMSDWKNEIKEEEKMNNIFKNEETSDVAAKMISANFSKDITSLSISVRITSFINILIEPAKRMAAMLPGNPMYCMQLTMMMNDLNEVCEHLGGVWKEGLGSVIEVDNLYEIYENTMGPELIYTTTSKVGEESLFVSLKKEMDYDTVNAIGLLMKRLVQRYCDLANDYVPTLCSVDNIIRAWRSYCAIDDRGIARRSSAVTESWRDIESFVKRRLWPNNDYVPYEKEIVNPSYYDPEFLSDLEELINKIPDVMYR